MSTLIAPAKEAYEKAISKDWNGMVKYYEGNPVRVLRPITVSKDNALHIAVESKKLYPLDKLLDIVEVYEQFFSEAFGMEGGEKPITMRNAYGNTVLHQAALVGNYDAVKFLVKNYPFLLPINNAFDETPLFLAASFGETEIVEHLVKISENIGERTINGLHQIHCTSRGIPILHAAVQGEHFDTALLLLKLDESLGELKDKYGKTSLHLLAKMPSAFKSGYPMGFFKWILYSCLPIEDTEEERERHNSFSLVFDQCCSNILKVLKGIYISICKFLFDGWPILKKVWDVKRKHANALRLAKLLTKKDNSWERFVEAKNSSSGFVTLSYSSSSKDQPDEDQYAEDDESRNKDQPDGEKSICIYDQSDKDNISRNKDQPDGEKSRKNEEQVKEKQSEEREDQPETDRIEVLKEEELLDLETQGGKNPKTREMFDHNIEIEEEKTTQRKKPATTTTNAAQEVVTEGRKKKYLQIPLFLATENGIIEIVEKIVEEHPQAAEHINNKGQNILHVAIMYRRKKIFRMITKSMRLARLTLGSDNNGFTLLHHVANTEYYTGGSMPVPALKLQEEFKWFERVQEIVPSHYAMHRARVMEGTGEEQKERWYTASELFKKNHKDQLKEAQQWVKDTSQSCSTVAVLVATVVFAAAYTTPGGFEKGVPILLHSPYFLFFAIMDVVSLACSLTAVVMFLSILSSPFDQEEFRRSLPRKLTFGFTLLFFSIVTTMLTFGATILLTIHLEQKSIMSLLSIAAFFPVLVFAMMQFRLYKLAFEGSMVELVNDIRRSLPSCLLTKRCRENLLSSF